MPCSWQLLLGTILLASSSYNATGARIKRSVKAHRTQNANCPLCNLTSTTVGNEFAWCHQRMQRQYPGEEAKWQSECSNWYVCSDVCNMCKWDRGKCRNTGQTIELSESGPCGVSVDAHCNPPTPAPPCQEEAFCANEASTAKCDSAAWRNTGQCQCSCRKLRPHILFYLIDDMGWNDFAHSSDLQPAWSFLHEKVLPKSIHVDATYTEILCAPSRSSLVSGRFRHLIKDGKMWGSFSASAERSLSQRLATQGYHSYAIGKWHMGRTSWRDTPSGRGFERYFGDYDNGDHFLHCSDKGGFDLHYEESVPWESSAASPEKPHHSFPSNVVGKFKTELFNEKAKEFIEGHKSRYPDDPLFMYYAEYSLHAPFEVPQRYIDERCTEDKGFASFRNSNRVTFCGMAAALDESLAKLTSYFGDDNYILIMQSDNGGPTWREAASGNNWPLRGNKGEQWEGGNRVRSIITGTHPELTNSITLGKTYSGGFAHIVDWHATMLQLGHSTPLDNSPPNDISGKSMWTALITDSKSPRVEFGGTSRGSTYHEQFSSSTHWKIIGACYGGVSGRGENTGYWWPVRNIDNDEYMKLHAGSAAGLVCPKSMMLFNITGDKEEAHDLAATYPDVLKRLSDRLHVFLNSGRVSNGNDNYAPRQPEAREATAIWQEQGAKVVDYRCPKDPPEASYPFWDEV